MILEISAFEEMLQPMPSSEESSLGFLMECFIPGNGKNLVCDCLGTFKRCRSVGLFMQSVWFQLCKINIGCLDINK